MFSNNINLKGIDGQAGAAERGCAMCIVRRLSVQLHSLLLWRTSQFAQGTQIRITHYYTQAIVNLLLQTTPNSQLWTLKRIVGTHAGHTIRILNYYNMDIMRQERMRSRACPCVVLQHAEESDFWRASRRGCGLRPGGGESRSTRRGSGVEPNSCSRWAGNGLNVDCRRAACPPLAR